MSLLDDVSIVVTPNGYKAGELYAVVPVPTEGAELVTNGDFSSDASWTKGTGWTISGGTATCDGTQTGNSNLYQAPFYVAGKRYKTKLTVNSISGTLKVFTGTAVQVLTITSAGDYEVIALSSSTTLYLQSTASTTVEIDNVSVKEYTAADMDVTRATAATRVDEAGLVNYAEIVSDTELVTNGDFTQTPLGTGWTVVDTDADNFVVFDGFTARLKFLNLSPVTQFRTTDIIMEAGKTYKLIVDVALVTSGGIKISGGGMEQTFNTAGVSTRILQPTSNARLRFFRATGNVDITLNSVSLKEITRDNVPRIDYSGGGCPHILAEPQSTNSITYSEDFSQWLTVGSPTLTNNYGVSPDGTQNSTRLQMVVNDRIYIATSLSGDINFSVYLKGTGTIRLRDNTNVYLEDVVLTSEWVRYNLVFNSTITSVQIQQVSGTSDLQIWGAQCENLSYSTSYIPTSGSTVTRNQDQFTRDGIGSLINSTEGILFVEMAALSNDGVFRIISLSDGGTTNRVSLIYNTTSNSIRVMVVSTSTVFDTSNSVTSTLDFHKIAIKWKLNDFAVWIDGVEVATDTSGATPVGLDRIVFDVGNGSLNFFGKVKQLQVYKTALTDAQLTSLTS